MARPTKLTPDVHKLIVGMIEAGNFIETAAAAAGVDRDTIRNWLKRGARSRGGAFRDFRDAVVQAQARAEATLVGLVALAANGEAPEVDENGTVLRPGSPPKWQAGAWLLERKHPERWGRRLRVETTAPVPADPFAGRSAEDLDYYAEHGHFPEEKPGAKPEAPAQSAPATPERKPEG